MKLTHPESKQTIEVRDDAAEPYVSQGWIDKSAKKADDKSEGK